VATITPNPLIMRDSTFVVAADEFAAALSSAAFTPAASVISFKGLRPSATYSAATTATWTCDLTFVQDLTAGSLTNYLFANEGAEIAVTFVPAVGGPSISATIIVTPGAIGGAIDTYGQATVSLGVKGKPTIIPSANTIPVISGASVTTGPIAGGNIVRVTGSKFTGTSSVKFGTVAATSFFVDSDGALFATAPAQAVGSKPITVQNAIGVSTTTAPYTYA